MVEDSSDNPPAAPMRLMRPGALVDEVVADHVADVSAGGDEIAARDALATRLRDTVGADEMALTSPRQIIRFSWGQPDSPVHSEPDWSSSDRVFVSVLFGSEEELRVMCDFRGDKYGVVSVN